VLKLNTFVQYFLIKRRKSLRYIDLEGLPKIKNTESINWKESIGKNINFKYDDIVGVLKIIDYKSSKIKIIYLNEIYLIDRHSLLNCKIFKIVKRKNPNYVKIGINDIPTTANWMIKFFQGGEEEAMKYTRTTNKKIYPVCPNCGSIKKEPISISELYRTKKFTCICSDNYSFPNKIMFNILEYLKIDFNIEKRFSWCIYKLNGTDKIGIYDFYFELGDKKYIVEMDGRWHKKDNKMSGVSSEISKYIDSEKDRLAKENNIEMIRIDCEKSDFEFIKNNIYNSKLNEILELDKVDWKEVESKCLNSRVKIVCDYKKENPNITAKQISNITKVGYRTVKRYLTIGTKLNLCNYNYKEEIRKGVIFINKNFKTKKVEIFKDGISLGVFESMSELARNSENLFNEAFNVSNISNSIKRDKKYKGYTFKYIIRSDK
jgi:very-short-patch-repair endonuclease